MSKQGLGRDEIHDAAWGENYPHPLVSCMMPLIAMLAVLAIMLFGLQLWQLSLPRDTSIPPVEGLKVEQATSDLQHAHLSVEILKQRQASETIPNDAVISADPPGGHRVKQGRLVRLLLSSGSGYTTIPDVRELPQVTARERLEQANLLIASESYQYHNAIPYDRVISISPKPGAKVRRNSTVNLVLSKGAESQAEGAQPVMRTTSVTVDLPKDGAQPNEVRIDVTDDDGTRTVYQKQRQPGDKVIETVQGNGEMTIEVYFGDQLILTKKY